MNAICRIDVAAHFDGPEPLVLVGPLDSSMSFTPSLCTKIERFPFVVNARWDASGSRLIVQLETARVLWVHEIRRLIELEFIDSVLWTHQLDFDRFTYSIEYQVRPVPGDAEGSTEVTFPRADA